MREIKFRMWHRPQNRMYSAKELGEDQLTLMPDGGGFVNVSGADIKMSQIDDNRKMIPLQYTGLKDKNGKEIYEGDIVILDGGGELYYFSVEFENGCFGIRTNGKDFAELKYYIDMSFVDAEIIGNIYENSELLEDENGK